MIRHLLWMVLAMSPVAIAAHDHDHGLDHKHAHAAHVHGTAKLEVAVEGAELHIHLEAPLDSLLGFEHAPGNDQERAAVARLRDLLGRGDKLFAPTTAAQCRFVGVDVVAPVLESKPGTAKGDGHGDLDADFRFTCALPGKLTGMEVRLTDAFPRMRSIDAQVAGPKGQTAAKLSGKMRFLSW